MSDFCRLLTGTLAEIQQTGLLRHVREVHSPQGRHITVQGRELVNFSSNDYLGLANHPALKEAAIRAVDRYGAGAGASRLICGSLKPFHDLEEALAAFKGTEACLTFSTGYATALGVITALLGKDDLLVIDRLSHACIVDAARLCGARLRVFKHNDVADLERILKWAKGQDRKTGAKRRNTLIVTESVFSMDGDLAPLKQMVELKERNGAWFMVDEAHATGLFGKHRGGLIEEAGVSDRVEIQMGTLGKAVGASGGYVCGSRKLIDLLINKARGFVFSTAPVPAAAAAAKAGIELIQSDEGGIRREQVWKNAHFTEHRFGVSNLEICAPDSAILPIMIGDEKAAVHASTALQEKGFFIPAVRFPTVGRGKARLRMTVTADHDAEQLNALAIALRETLHTGA